MPASSPGAEVLVSAGGGAVGRRLLEVAMLAREQTLLRGATWRVLAGVNCSEADFRALGRLAAPGIVLERSREDFPALLANCALSISQAGYNTVAETLKARVRAGLVPFPGGGEAGQTLDAQLLAHPGAVVSRVGDGLTVDLWWRDDDASAPSAAVRQLLQLSKASGVPLALAVIPLGAKPELFEALGASVLMHGTDHRNRAAAAEKKSEFPLAEPEVEAIARLAAARERLARLAGASVLPALPPPLKPFKRPP